VSRGLSSFPGEAALWTVNARALVPTTPALGILLMRRLETRKSLPNGVRSVWRSIGIAAVTAILVAYADLSVARSAKDAATEVSLLKDPSRTVWFEGHWGWLGKVPPERYRIFEVIARIVPPEHAVK
jgi:hypothetical protein